MVVRTVLLTVLLSLAGKIVYLEILIEKPDKTQPYNVIKSNQIDRHGGRVRVLNISRSVSRYLVIEFENPSSVQVEFSTKITFMSSQY